MRYEKTIANGDASMKISDDYKATVNMIDAEETTVQITGEDEAVKIIAEFEDESGDSMHDEDAIFSKYEELHKFRP